jgi:hypothetical protein
MPAKAKTAIASEWSFSNNAAPPNKTSEAETQLDLSSHFLRVSSLTLT